jgi:uncharacterized protein (TIRG00374 family)
MATGRLSEKAKVRLRSVAGVGLSYGVAVGCLYWVFHNLPFHQVLPYMDRLDWWSILAAALLNVVVYFCAALEWQTLLRPLGRISFWRTVQALFAGRFANDVLPVHAGYALRIFLVARWADKSAALVIPSLLIERFLDSFWLVASIGTTLFFFPLPPAVIHTMEGLTAAIVVGAAVSLWIVRRSRKRMKPGRPPRLVHWPPVRKLAQILRKFGEGLRGIAASGLLPVAVSLSILKLALQGLAFLVLLWGVGFTFPLWVSGILFLICYVGISLPSTPASLGVFQVFCVTGLTFFGIPKPEATGFALLSFVIVTVPLSLCGFIAFAQSGLTFRQVRRQVAAWKSARRATQHS